MTKSKRKGDPMTKDDYKQRHADDESDHALNHSEPFHKASADVLKTRKIYKAKRPVATAAATTEAGKNPFGGVSLVHDSQAAAAAPAKNPFAQVKLVASTSTTSTASQSQKKETEEDKAALLSNNKKARTESTTEKEDAATTDTAEKKNAAKVNDSEQQQKKQSANNDTTTTKQAPVEDEGTATSEKKGEDSPSFSKQSEKSSDDDTSSKPVFGASTGFSGFGATKPSSSGGFVFGSSASSSSGGGFQGFGTAKGSSKDDNDKPFSAFGGGGGFGEATGSGFGATAASSSSFKGGFAAKPADAAAGGPLLDPTAATISTESKSSAEQEVTVSSSSKLVDLPEDYELKSGEEEEVVLLELRCKTYRLGPARTVQSTAETKASHPSVPPSNPSVPSAASLVQDKEKQDEDDDNETETAKQDEETTAAAMKWHEVGIGPLKVLRHAVDNKSTRMVQRRESTPGGPATAVCLNVRLQTLRLTAPSETHVQVVTIEDNKPSTYLFKFKLASEAAKLTQCLEKIAQEQDNDDSKSAPADSK